MPPTNNFEECCEWIWQSWRSCFRYAKNVYALVLQGFETFSGNEIATLGYVGATWCEKLFFDEDSVCRDVVESMDVKGGSLVACYNCIWMTDSPFQPLIEEVSFDPAISVFWVFEKIQFVDFECCLAGLYVSISSKIIESCHVLIHIWRFNWQIYNFCS